MATNPMDPVNKPGEEGVIPTAKDAAPVADGGKIDIDAILEKVNITPDLKPMYDKAVLAGLRIMFDKKSHVMLIEQLDKEGPLPGKIAEGVIALMYMLWEQSNKTLPPKLLVPITFTLTLRAFEFCQMSGEQEATKETLGEAVDLTTTRIMKEFGVEEGQVEQLVQQQTAQVNGGQPPTEQPPAEQPPTKQPPMSGGGMLEQGGM